MRLCLRLAALAVALVGLALGLTWLRTDTAQAGNRLHSLFRAKRDLEKECCRLELAIARLKNQERLRSQAVSLREEVEQEPGKNRSLVRGKSGARTGSALAGRNVPAPP